METRLAQAGLDAIRRMMRAGATSNARPVSREAAAVMARDVLVKRGERALDGKVLRRASQQAGLEGGHISKELKLDQAGKAFMVKGFKHGQEYRAIGDKVGADVARALGLETPAVHVSRRNLGGKRQLVTVQPMVPHSGQRLPVDPHQLTKKQVDQLTASQVVRWLIGDHDGKVANFLVKKNGDVVTIDLGNMFRFFPEDQLAKGYAPNWEEPVYNRIWGAYAKGTLPVDFRPGLQMAKRIQAMPDAEFVKLLEPYVKSRYATADIPASLPTAEHFMRKALTRKQNVGQDLVKFYDGLAKERGLAGGLAEALRTALK